MRENEINIIMSKMAENNIHEREENIKKMKAEKEMKVCSAKK